MIILVRCRRRRPSAHLALSASRLGHGPPQVSGRPRPNRSRSRGIDTVGTRRSLTRTSSPKGRPDGDGARTAAAVPTRFRRDHAPRRVVGSAPRRFYTAHGFHRLRHVGGFSERELLVRVVSVALLLTGAVRRVSARVIRSEAGVVAGLADLLASTPDSALPRIVPRHLPLLPGSILQSV